jgi:hypothetical protein
MKPRCPSWFLVAIAFLATSALAAETKPLPDGRYLFAAVPGIRNYLEFGGHGVLVFDIDHGHRLVKRIASAGLDAQGKPLNVKGICAHAGTQRLYVSTTQNLMAFDLVTDKIVWDKKYDGGCDRMSITPDGKTLFLPSLEKDHWHVVNAADGGVITKIVPKSAAHNTIVGPDGKEAYLAGIKSSLLTVVDTQTMAQRTVGPFGHFIRPFTVNGRQTRVYVTVNDLLGFEIGDLKTGKLLHRVEVTGFEKGAVKRHSCPSHGIALTLDEKEVWVCDAHNSRLHVFDNTVSPPKQVASIGPLREQPGWITLSIDGKFVYASTGEIIDPKTRKIVATLADENGGPVHSEKVIEIDFAGGKAVRNGDQFAIGGVR